MRRRFPALCAAVLAGCSVVLAATGCTGGGSFRRESEDIPDFVERVEPKRTPESQVVVPPYPAESALVPLLVAPTSTANVFVDPASISVGDDAVVRLTYVVVSTSGVHNAFYEGFRCDDRVYKTYAWAVGEGPFHAMSDSEWKTIPWSGINRFRDDLRSFYLCGNFSTPRQPAEILRYVRDGTPPND